MNDSTPKGRGASTPILPLPAVPASQVPGALVAVYRRFADLARKWGHVKGKVVNLAAQFGKSARTFHYWLAHLRADGWIYTETNGRLLFIWCLVPVPPKEDKNAGSDVATGRKPPFSVPPVADLIAEGKRSVCRPKRLYPDRSRIRQGQQTAPAIPEKPAPAPDPGFAAAVEILRQEGMPETSAKQIAREIPDVKRLRDAIAYYRQRVASGQNILNRIGYIREAARRKKTPTSATSGGMTAAEERQREDDARRRIVTAPKDFVLNTGKRPPQPSTCPVQAGDGLSPKERLAALRRAEKGYNSPTPKGFCEEMGRLYHQEQSFGGKAVAA